MRDVHSIIYITKTVENENLIVKNYPNLYEQNKKLFWEYGNLHFFNTCKRHLIFNANDEYDHIVLIMNVELTKESVETVTNLIEQ